MKKLMLILLVLAATSQAKLNYGLHFDDEGNIIRPDQELLAQGLDDEKAGFKKSAMKNFIKSAEFGNYHAMSLVGLYHLQDEDYIKAHAWFNLIDLAQIPNRPYIEKIITNLEIVLKPKQLDKAKKLKAKLAETYGTYPTLLRREEWKKNLKFTGTHIKGYIPASLNFRLNSGRTITAFDVREQVNDFIYEYEFDVGQGNVTLEEIEVVDIDSETNQ